MSNDATKKTLLSDYLNENDYKELGHSIILRNDTSGVSYLQFEDIQITELKIDSICLSLPRNICQLGHNITFIIYDSPLKKVFKKFPNIDTTNGLPIIGKVVEFEVDDELVHIELKFTQFKEHSWNEIKGDYEQQQIRISTLISEVKK
ncbi:hypothetical protein [Halobacteriovorax sp. HLS]|uniref:hypothetical protein n=1 Tax=Halobacteriovorax sp. HLS TaxID=2234000 RepID=UPI000FDC8E8A|nr:hypothetical protein [Halobacteriovorax sp. HLS]